MAFFWQLRTARLLCYREGGMLFILLHIHISSRNGESMMTESTAAMPSSPAKRIRRNFEIKLVMKLK